MPDLLRSRTASRKSIDRHKNHDAKTLRLHGVKYKPGVKQNLLSEGVTSSVLSCRGSRRPWKANNIKTRQTLGGGSGNLDSSEASHLQKMHCFEACEVNAVEVGRFICCLNLPPSEGSRSRRASFHPDLALHFPPLSLRSLILERPLARATRAPSFCPPLSLRLQLQE